ncbi:DUF3047 domain-containing protein [Pseudomonadota bacterium]
MTGLSDQSPPSRGSIGRKCALLILLCAALPLLAADSLVGAFSTQGLMGWKETSFAGNTQYRIVKMDGVSVLKAESRASASGLAFETEVDLEQTPYLYWRWRVENTLGNIDERTKQGDDYPARLYVVKKGGLLPWRTRAIDYVWSSNRPQGSSWPNAYTDKAQMLALRSGNTELGQWVTERRNVREDFQRLFGEEITTIDVIAIMTDTDNSSGHAVAFYGDIRFASE